jgi:hypothetical protein
MIRVLAAVDSSIRSVMVCANERCVFLSSSGPKHAALLGSDYVKYVIFLQLRQLEVAQKGASDEKNSLFKRSQAEWTNKKEAETDDEDSLETR